MSLHCIAQNYPLEPTAAQRRQYMSFFRGLGHVLPCKFCRNSYKKFISRYGKAPLNMRAMRNRETFSRWLYDVHNCVNDRLKVRRRPSFEAVRKKYERYRAHTCSDSTKEKGSIAHRCIGKKGFRKRARIIVEACK